MSLTKEGCSQSLLARLPTLETTLCRILGSVPHGVDLFSLFDDGELRTSRLNTVHLILFAMSSPSRASLHHTATMCRTPCVLRTLFVSRNP